MIRKLVITILGILALSLPVMAQNPAPLTNDEVQAVSDINNVFRRAVEIAQPAVVEVHLFQNNGVYEQNTGLGSGFIIDKDGYIITNNHVAADQDRISVVLADGRAFEVVETMLDPDTDLAVLKIDPAGKDLPVIKFGDSDKAMVGDFVMAIGSPFEFSQTVTMGIISHKGRQTRILGQWGLADFIQTDADINKGNSGGPLINLYGEVIGINSNIFSPTGVSAGFGFAVPSNIAKDVSSQLIANKSVKRGYLGVTLISKTISELKQLKDEEILSLTAGVLDDASYLKRMLANLPDDFQGVLVTTVAQDTPAAQGGMRSYDIVTSFNGKKYSQSAPLRQDIASTKPETQTTFEVWREGELINLTVTLGDRESAREQMDQQTRRTANNAPRWSLPDEFFQPPTEVLPFGDPYSDQKPKLGITIENITPELARQYGYPQVNGRINQVIVTGVRIGSLAQNNGISEGDIIVAVNGKKIKDANELKQIIQNSDLNNGITMSIKNSQGEKDISISANNL
ncbi:MAG: trypsin-like peptidase domain-containing protein [Sedimentisphaerales bacterium]|nr:trypsin-like peptidase domain-containing protein [Sedimentisphaerales bacterium]MBN2841805.1 trypsin-like peptidase domain-containing protein [Sedimentisphaerales bacterium]